MTGQLDRKLERMSLVSVSSNSMVAPEPVRESAVRQTLGRACRAFGIENHRDSVAGGTECSVGDLRRVCQIRSFRCPVLSKLKPPNCVSSSSKVPRCFACLDVVVLNLITPGVV